MFKIISFKKTESTLENVVHLRKIRCMKTYIIFIFLILCYNGNSQNRFRTIVHESEYVSTKNDLDSLKNHDFKPLIKGGEISYVFGVIGNEYKRIRIKILDVVKDSLNPYVYHIKGASKVGSNLERFEGVIRLDGIKQLKPTVVEIDDQSMPSIYEGVLSASYEFYEPKNNKHSGFFSGTYHGKFRITAENEVLCNDLDLFSDRYINNMFVGTWTDYQTNDSKLCKWADFRVPDVSGDFDLGAGEFSPNKKYNDKGWKTYHEAFFNNDKKALEIEEGTWWK